MDFLDSIKNFEKYFSDRTPKRSTRYLESKGHKNIFKKDFKNYEEKSISLPHLE